MRKKSAEVNEEKDQKSTGSSIIWLVFGIVVLFVVWAQSFEINKTVRANGSLISETRVQIIQAVDGGVVSEINVSEGDIVAPGQVLARIDQTRFEAQTNEVLARVNALKGKVARLRGEVTSSLPTFPDELLASENIVKLELAIYEQRLKRLMDETAMQQRFIDLALSEKKIVEGLFATGDVSKSDVLAAERSYLDATSKLDSIKNDFFQSASQELADAEDELAQSLEVLGQRMSVLEASTLRALVAGQVKNISVTTIGAVTKPGEEIMQIVPVGVQLFVEAKVRTADIADIKTGDLATLRFEAFDSATFGTVDGTVTFISGDTISEANGRGGEDRFYVAHVSLPSSSVLTSIGREVDLMPGMAAQVDIQAGKRTVMAYLLRPIMKTLEESLTEK
jgi:adhesin transport system membrane fusion protein